MDTKFANLSKLENKFIIQGIKNKKYSLFLKTKFN